MCCKTFINALKDKAIVLFFNITFPFFLSSVVKYFLSVMMYNLAFSSPTSDCIGQEITMRFRISQGIGNSLLIFIWLLQKQ